jgi:hypothetical protein
MTQTETSHPTISRYLDEPLQVGEPDLSGPLAVFPIFAPAPRLEYVAFSQGRTAGVVVKELESSASVRDLLIENPTTTPVLLYEGEEVLGAQQNRTFDTSVLVPAGEILQAPVTCVEAGRWEDSRHHEEFRPSPQAADPELRRAKALQARRNLAESGEARADQAAVWTDVASRAHRHDVHSPTGSMHDVYEGRRDQLGELIGPIVLHDGQCGALVAIGERFTVLDWVSRPDVFGALHAPLVQGYGLDALEVNTTATPMRVSEAEAFVATVTASRALERDAIGLGRDLRFDADGLVGSGLVAGEELVQLTAFGGDADSDQRPFQHTRIRRPSRRR